MTGTLENAARLLVKKLQIGRSDGTITPQKLIKGRELAAAWNAKFNDGVDDIDVREWVNYARGVLGFPIYSERGKEGGYCFCISEQEWNRTKAHIKSSIKLQLAAATAPDKYFTNLHQQEAFTGNQALDSFLEEAEATLVRE